MGVTGPIYEFNDMAEFKQGGYWANIRISTIWQNRSMGVTRPIYEFNPTTLFQYRADVYVYRADVTETVPPTSSIYITMGYWPARARSCCQTPNTSGVTRSIYSTPYKHNSRAHESSQGTGQHGCEAVAKRRQQVREAPAEQVVLVRAVRCGSL